MITDDKLEPLRALLRAKMKRQERLQGMRDLLGDAGVIALVLDMPDALYAWGLDYGFLLDTFSPPIPEDKFFRSNKLNVAYSTLNNGLPATGGFTIPMRLESAINMETNGENVTISGAGASAEVTELITQIVDTLLSSYGTAATDVLEITVNDV